jgi:transposase
VQLISTPWESRNLVHILQRLSSHYTYLLPQPYEQLAWEKGEPPPHTQYTSHGETWEFYSFVSKWGKSGMMSVIEAARRSGVPMRQNENAQNHGHPRTAHLIQIYTDVLLPFIADLREKRHLAQSDRVILLADNYPTHHAKGAIRFLRSHNIDMVFSPPYSGDLNVIELCWHHWKDKLSRYTLKGNQGSPSFLKNSVSAWNDVPVQTIKKTVRQFERRLRRCLERGGSEFPVHDL